MSNSATSTEAPAPSSNGNVPASPLAWLIAIGAWFLPGFGHLVLRRWGRAAAIFLCVAGLAVLGYEMRGRAYSLHGVDIFGILNHIAEVGAGIFYFLSHTFEPAGPDTARAVGDLGTRFLDFAGLLNFLCILDAFLIARKIKP